MDNHVKSETPFAKAGILSRLSFCWLNPLMKKGKKKAFEDDDIPMLRKRDRAETCYLMFMEQLKKQKQTEPSLLWVIILCYWKEILISGFFALFNIITLSASPLFLGAFIDVAEGKESFKHEGYVLVILLLFTKFIESLSQRQWYFRCGLLGIQVRSLLSAAIYKKQLRVSSAAKTKLSSGEIINYVTVDCYRVGEFPFWLHQTWAACLQVCLGLAILFRAVGVASLAAFVVIVLSVLGNTPLAKLQHEFQSKLVIAQDKRLKAISEAILDIKVLKLYAWEMYFKSIIDKLRKEEIKFLEVNQRMKGYNTFLFWISPALVSAATFVTCYFIRVPLNPGNVFTFLATMRVLQEPVMRTPDIIAMTIHAKVAFSRIVFFLAAEELECQKFRQMECTEHHKHAISISSGNFSWEGNPSMLTLKSVNLEVKSGEKVAIRGEVGAGKSTLLAAILGEVPKVEGMVQAYGKIAYVSQMAWIQSGSIQDNILFDCTMDKQIYQETIEKCSLVKDLEMLPYGDLTEIGERGINLSGGQKQRIQLACALHQDADIYLLDDPFSAVDADTAGNIFNLMADGEIQHVAPYHLMLSSNRAFHNLFKAHEDTATAENGASPDKCGISSEDTQKIYCRDQLIGSVEHQLIEREERETGDTGWKPFMFFTLFRSLATVALGMKASESIFNQLLSSLFHAPTAFFESTPLGRILSRVSSDLSIVDLDLASNFVKTVMAAIITLVYLGVLAVITWQVVFVSIPMVYMVILVQRYYSSSANELMRINGTSKSMIASHLGESITGAVTIRAFGEEDRFFTENLNLIDRNASSSFHIFSSNEWLIQRLETLCAIILCSSAFVMVLLPAKTIGSGRIHWDDTGFCLNMHLVFSVQVKCTLANDIISVERLNQYMLIPSEASEVIEENRPLPSWPAIGRVEIRDLKIRYRLNTPIVLHGMSCTFEGGHMIGIVGRTGSGKSTLIGAPLVEPIEGKIIIDGVDISTIGLHDLRSRLGIIPQDPTLFNGTVRYNLDPFSQHTDQEIWEVLAKCQLRETVQEKEEGLDSSVQQDGVNWSMGQRQLFCLGRALLRGSQILVLDEATASIDNTTDAILQQTIRTEFKKCTVITVAHRIPTITDSSMVLVLSDGKVIEYDEPMKLIKEEGSLFGQLVKDYWSHIHSAD
ncbi:hypothetical protein C5167_027315 [Papaver somniferum]|nr:hypothetical protein C5167_027315 [Papaver somniferum]